MSNVSLDDLISQGENLLAASHVRSYGGDFVPHKEFEEWKRIADLFLQNKYPGWLQTADFHRLVQEQNSRTFHCEKLLAILKAFKSIQPQEKACVDYHAILINVFEKFHQVAIQLKRRHNGRETLRIEDEYDVQDLMEALLKLFFSDVRPEEWCPSYAGGSKRMDFLLKDEEVAIEVKKTRDTLKDKEIGEQLIIDIANYKMHPNCKRLYCFVYDPDSLIRNSRGIESDLTNITDDLEVVVCVWPK